MYRRNSANVNELINRFEISTDQGEMDNLKYVKMMRSQGRNYNADLYGSGLMDMPGEMDIGRSLMKYGDPAAHFSNPNLAPKGTPMTNAKKLTQQKVASLLQRVGGFLEMLSRFPLPRMSTMSVGLISLFATFVSPRNLTDKFLYPGFRLMFCIVYPAYASYKAIRTKNVKEYVRWMMFWVVFAFLTVMEIMSDVFLSWLPFYFELKVIVLIWLLAGKGSSSIYRNVIHPSLVKREQDIDEFIYIAQEQGYTAALRMSSKGVHSITNVIMANEDFSQNLSRNYSMSDISDADTLQSIEELDDSVRIRKYSAGKLPGSKFMNYSYEDISSGYSSPDASIRSMPPMFPEPRNRSRIPKDEFNGDLGMGQEIYYRNDSKIAKKFQKIEEIHEIPKALTDEEIVRAYENLRKQKDSEVKPKKESEKSESENDARKKEDSMPENMKDKYEQFLKWMENQEKPKNDNEDKPIPIIEKEIIPAEQEEPAKVNFQEDIIIKDVMNVEVKNEHENSVSETNEEILESENLISDFDEFKDTISVSSEENFEEPENVSSLIEENIQNDTEKEPLKPQDEEILILEESKETAQQNMELNDEKGLDELTRDSDLASVDQLQNGFEMSEDSKETTVPETVPDTIPVTIIESAPEDSRPVQAPTPPEKPLIICETPKETGIPMKSQKSTPKIKKVPLNDLEQEQDIIKSIKGSLENIEKIMIEAKITLSDAPLEIKSSITNLSGSTLSLASTRSREPSTDSSKKRAASHSKGRAPNPPPLSLPKEVASKAPLDPPTSSRSSSKTNEYFDKSTKKFFKETEL